MNTKLILPTDSEAEETIEQKANVIPLQLLTGGKEPTDNWLTKIKEGSLFVCKRKTQRGEVQLFLDEWCLVNNRTKTYLLSTNLNQEAFVRVNPLEFSRYNDLVEVIEEGKEE